MYLLTDTAKVLFDDRIMAIVVRLVDADNRWESVNRTAHITVGTRDDSVKPKESNDLLARWLDEGVTEARIGELIFEPKLVVKGKVRAVLSR